jgi:hypothetical protein
MRPKSKVTTGGGRNEMQAQAIALRAGSMTNGLLRSLVCRRTESEAFETGVAPPMGVAAYPAGTYH